MMLTLMCRSVGLDWSIGRFIPTEEKSRYGSRTPRNTTSLSHGLRLTRWFVRQSSLLLLLLLLLTKKEAAENFGPGPIIIAVPYRSVGPQETPPSYTPKSGVKYPRFFTSFPFRQECQRGLMLFLTVDHFRAMVEPLLLLWCGSRATDSYNVRNHIERATMAVSKSPIGMQAPIGEHLSQAYHAPLCQWERRKAVLRHAESSRRR